MVDSETFSIITRAFLKRKSEEADRRIAFRERMEKLENKA